MTEWIDRNVALYIILNICVIILFVAIGMLILILTYGIKLNQFMEQTQIIYDIITKI